MKWRRKSAPKSPLQVGTAVVEEVATVLAEQQPDQSVDPISTPEETRFETTTQTHFDCAPKYCKDMTSCEEAVYQLTVCGFGRLDANNDGVPCEAICTAAAFVKVTIIPPATAQVEESATESDEEEVGTVTRVIDGDTIDVLLDGVNTVRIRYLQMNTARARSSLLPRGDASQRRSRRQPDCAPRSG